jgi:hypothetical protein
MVVRKPIRLGTTPQRLVVTSILSLWFVLPLPETAETSSIPCTISAELIAGVILESEGGGSATVDTGAHCGFWVVGIDAAAGPGVVHAEGVSAVSGSGNCKTNAFVGRPPFASGGLSSQAPTPRLTRPSSASSASPVVTYLERAATSLTMFRLLELIRFSWDPGSRVLLTRLDSDALFARNSKLIRERIRSHLECRM